MNGDPGAALGLTLTAAFLGAIGANLRAGRGLTQINGRPLHPRDRGAFGEFLGSVFMAIGAIVGYMAVVMALMPRADADVFAAFGGMMIGVCLLHMVRGLRHFGRG